jgi:hypothetical protein
MSARRSIPTCNKRTVCECVLHIMESLFYITLHMRQNYLLCVLSLYVLGGMHVTVIIVSMLQEVAVAHVTRLLAPFVYIGNYYVAKYFGVLVQTAR